MSSCVTDAEIAMSRPTLDHSISCEALAFSAPRALHLFIARHPKQMVPVSRIYSFGDLNVYCKLDVFKYIKAKDRVSFESVVSEWKTLLRGLTTNFDLRFLEVDGIRRSLSFTCAEPYYSRMGKLTNLQNLIVPPGFPLDFGRLARLCPSLVSVKVGKRVTLIDNYELVKFCSALDGDAQFTTLRFPNPSSLGLSSELPFRAAMAKCPNLSHIVVDNFDHIDWIDPIAQQIKQLTVNGNQSPVEFVDIIKKLKNVNKLTITSLSYKCAIALRKLHAIIMRKVTVSKLKIHEESSSRLQVSLTYLTGLTSLTCGSDVVSMVISNNSKTIVKVDLEIAPQTLMQCSRLKKLHIFDEMEFELLTNVLTKNVGIRKLFVNITGFNNDQFKSLLKLCSKLRHIAFFFGWDAIERPLEQILVEYSKRFPKRAIRLTLVFNKKRENYPFEFNPVWVQRGYSEPKQIVNLTITEMVTTNWIMHKQELNAM